LSQAKVRSTTIAVEQLKACRVCGAFDDFELLPADAGSGGREASHRRESIDSQSVKTTRRGPRATTRQDSQARNAPHCDRYCVCCRPSDPAMSSRDGPAVIDDHTLFPWLPSLADSVSNALLRELVKFGDYI